MRTYAMHIAAALAALALAPAAHAANETATGTKPAKPASHCFASNNWNGWNAAASGDALYLRVGVKDIYRVDLTPGSHARKYPGEFLVNEVRGSNWICSALDLDLAISDDHGFRKPLIARKLVKLTPAEAAAIPKKERP